MKFKTATKPLNIKISKLKLILWNFPILLISLFVIVVVEQLPVCEAFCNCLTPMSMFGKLGKHGTVQSPLNNYPLSAASSIYGPQVAHPGERASWYTQSQLGNSNAYIPLANSYGQQQNSIKRFNLFQPKWRGSLFGPKKWMMDWRMMHANSFRPTNAFNPASGAGIGNYAAAAGGWSPNTALQIPNPPQAQLFPPSSGIGYQYSQNNIGLQQQQQPYSSFNSVPYGSTSTSGTGGGYSSQLNTNDGWSALPSANILPPYNSQTQNNQQLQQQLMNYANDNNNNNNYGILPADFVQPNRNNQQQSNNYGTKGSSGASKQSYNSGGGSTTKKSVLMANGGYNLFDAHLLGTDSGGYSNSLFNYEKNHLLPSKLLSTNSAAAGYAYPDWYTGVVDSPAKIAQQLYRTQKYRNAIKSAGLLR